MESMEWALLVVSVGGSLGAVSLIALACRIAIRSLDDGVARFTSGYLGMFGFCLGLLGGLGLIGAAGAHVGSSSLALAGVIAVNIVVQPIALLVCWTALRKLGLGLFGCVAYAWWRIPESDLTDVPPPLRRALARYCILQGLVGLPIGVAVSVAIASPLLP